MAHSSHRTDDPSCPRWVNKLRTNDVITPWHSKYQGALIIQDRPRQLSLNIKLTNDVITPSWATHLVIVLIITVSQPASQQVPGRTHHTGLTIQAVYQNYVKQLTTSFRRHIWRHMARCHTKHNRHDLSRHLKQQLVTPHRRSSLSMKHHSVTHTVYCSIKNEVCLYTNIVNIVPVT